MADVLGATDQGVHFQGGGQLCQGAPGLRVHNQGVGDNTVTADNHRQGNDWELPNIVDDYIHAIDQRQKLWPKGDLVKGTLQEDRHVSVTPYERTQQNEQVCVTSSQQIQGNTQIFINLGKHVPILDYGQPCATTTDVYLSIPDIQIVEDHCLQTPDGRVNKKETFNMGTVYRDSIVTCKGTVLIKEPSAQSISRSRTWSLGGLQRNVEKVSVQPSLSPTSPLVSGVSEIPSLSKTMKASSCSGAINSLSEAEHRKAKRKDSETNTDRCGSFYLDTNQQPDSLKRIGDLKEKDDDLSEEQCGDNNFEDEVNRSSGQSPNLTGGGEWKSSIHYMACCLGFVCGLSTVTQFPVLAAKHGGATFSLAYIVVVALCAAPMVYLETAIGQFSGGGPIKSWNIVPLFTGVGVAATLTSALITLYHSIYIAWFLLYIGLTFSSSIPLLQDPENKASRNRSSVKVLNGVGSETVTENTPYNLWSSLTGNFFHNDVLSLSSDSLGEIQPVILLCLTITWTLTFLCLCQGQHVMAKVMLVLSPIMWTLALCLLVKACLLDGAVDGIRFYLYPKWNSLINPQGGWLGASLALALPEQADLVWCPMWWDASRQVFYSIGLGTGALTTLSGHCRFHSNTHRNSMLIVVANATFSIVIGFVIFAFVGALGYKQNSPLEDLIQYDTDVSFLLVPEVLSQTEGVSVWVGFFFLLLALVSLNRLLVLVYNIITAVTELMTNRVSWVIQGRLTPTLLVCFGFMLSGILLTTQGGLYVARLLNSYVCKWGLFFLCMSECICVMWLYGGQQFLRCVQEMRKREEELWWRIMWSYVTPASCLVLMVLTWWGHESLGSGVYPIATNIEALGWVVSCLPILTIISGVAIRCGQAQGSFKQRLDTFIHTPRDWGRGYSGCGHDHALPDYIACSPEQSPTGVPPDVTSGLLWNLFTLASVADNKVTEVYVEGQDMELLPGGGYLTEAMEIEEYSIDSDSSGDENEERGNWTSKYEFLVSGLGYVVGLGNVWRFPFLVYRNGGGAFFIPYLLMLVFCGIPLVFMELAFGQYASLGPISIWKASPLFKGVGVSMVVISALLSIYYNMVVAWSLYYLFASMTNELPWSTCNNPWNTIWCNENRVIPRNCSVINATESWLNSTFNSSVVGTTPSGESTPSKLNPFCLDWPNSDYTNNSLDVLHKSGPRYNIPSEEYFYLSTLNISSDIGVYGDIQWKLSLNLLLAWVLIFFCLFKGIKSSGKVMLVITAVPYLLILTLLIQSSTLDGYLDGVKFYVTPKWHLLKDARVWSDAAAQVFFSLSVCWGGFTTLSSYNRFRNNIYRDAILICLGDTLMSVLSGFAVFAMIGILANQLHTKVENVVLSDVGLTFVAYPEAISRFPLAPVWSVLFFLMLSMIGLSTQMITVETIITALIDLNISFLKKKRLWLLLSLCCVLFLCGLPLTTQAGIYWLQLLDDYLAGWTVMVIAIVMCCSLAYVYGIKKFCYNIKQMTGENPSYWWKTMWCVVSPLVIVFILVFSMVDYVPAKFGVEEFPAWAQAIGFVLTILSLVPIPVCLIYQLCQHPGTITQRLRKCSLPQPGWGPALEKFWSVQYLPSVNSLLHQPIHDVAGSSIETVTDRVDFTTVGVRVPYVSESSLMTGSTTLNSPISRKHYDSIRQRAILQHAYSNPQCSTSVLNTSFEKLPVSRQDSCNSTEGYFVAPRKKKRVEMCDKSTQTIHSTIASRSRKTLTQSSDELVEPTSELTHPTSEVTQPTSEPTRPTSEVTQPTSESPRPTSEVTQPTSEPTRPTSEPTLPTSELTHPTSEVTQPTSEPTHPTSEVTQPTSELTRPTSEVTQPTSEPTHPTSEPTLPTSEPTLPTSEPTLPTSEPTQSSGEQQRSASEGTQPTNKGTKLKSERISFHDFTHPTSEGSPRDIELKTTASAEKQSNYELNESAGDKSGSEGTQSTSEGGTESNDGIQFVEEMQCGGSPNQYPFTIEVEISRL